jgi:hypothetical protein
MWPFARRRRIDQELFERLLANEAARAASASELEAKKAELELKKTELQLSNIDRETKATIELEEARDRLKQQRREWARKAREKLADARAKQAGYTYPGAVMNGQGGPCRMCQGVMVGVTAEEVLAHRAHMGWPTPQGGNG